MDFLEKLNPSQKEAVLATDGPLLVVAGAGSGKTRVLTYRIAHLISTGVSPSRILAVTFTNKAAGEMRERVEDLVGRSAPSWISTFHSACVRILRSHGGAIGLPDNFSIYDASDQLTTVRRVMRELNYDTKKFEPKAMLGRVSRSKNELVGPAEFNIQNDSDPIGKATAKIYSRYQKVLRENSALDFDDLLFEAVRLLQENAEVRTYYQERFQYLLIDEYQDTNRAQYELAKLLAAKHRNICVVGDADQSIYGWRGADIRNILRFQEDYPQARVVLLEQNYRSTKTILEAANQVISNNIMRQKKELWTANGQGDPIYLYEAQDERDEALYIAREIQKLSRSYSDYAVLYRTNAQSRVLEEAFRWRNIPFRIVGSLGFYDRMEVKDVLAYLRVLYNPQDSVSLERIINVPRRGIGKTTWQKLTDYAQKYEISPWQAICRLPGDGPPEELTGQIGRTKKPLLEFQALLSSLITAAGELPVDKLLHLVLDETGYLEQLAKGNRLEAETRIQNVQELFTVIKHFQEESADWSLGAFLESVALITDLDQLDEEDDAVTLMTLHSAKGLEFPVVFLAGLDDGLFPLSRAIWEEDQLEEERRLCYVGITRAMERLYITHTKLRTLFGHTERREPSRFIFEIPGELLENWEEEQRSSVAEPKAWRGEKSDSFSVGQRIVHGKFGQGTVVSVEGDGDTQELTVAFPQGGLRKLLVAYAPIQKVQ
jgi:DNA helicase-2/ATP-dependent DNA helicase PcrA